MNALNILKWFFVIIKEIFVTIVICICYLIVFLLAPQYVKMFAEYINQIWIWYLFCCLFGLYFVYSTFYQLADILFKNRIDKLKNIFKNKKES